MVTSEASIDIDRPPEEVFAFVTDFPRNPEWQRGMRSCTWTSPPPLRVGSTYRQHARFLDKDIHQSFEVTELAPGERVRFRSTSGSFPIAVTRTVTRLDDGRACFTEKVEGDTRGFYRIATPLLQLIVRSAIERDFPMLKRLLEAGDRRRAAAP